MTPTAKSGGFVWVWLLNKKKKTWYHVFPHLLWRCDLLASIPGKTEKTTTGIIKKTKERFHYWIILSFYGICNSLLILNRAVLVWTAVFFWHIWRLCSILVSKGVFHTNTKSLHHHMSAFPSVMSETKDPSKTSFSSSCCIHAAGGSFFYVYICTLHACPKPS